MRLPLLTILTLTLTTACSHQPNLTQNTCPLPYPTESQLTKDTGTNAPVFISDMKLHNSIQSQATKLIEDEQTTPAEELYKQHNRKNTTLTLPQLPAEPLTTDQLYRKHLPSVIVVGGIYKCNRCTKWHSGSASGFILTKEGIAVTNAHVISGDKNKTYVAMTSNGKAHPITEVLAYDKAADIAIIKLQGDNFTPIAIAPHAGVGQDITVISHPDRRFYTLTKGIVSRYAITPTKNGPAKRMFITADYAKGSSGAPVINHLGQVVGMVSSTQSIYYTQKDGQQQNLQMVMKLCVPSQSILDLIKPEKE